MRWRSPRSLRQDANHAGIDCRSDLPAQRVGDAVKLALAVAVLHDLVPAAERAPPPKGVALHWLRSARSASAQQGPCSGSQGCCATARGLLVGVAVLAISHIGPLQVCHEGSALQQPGLRILDAPRSADAVPDQLQSSDGSAVALLEPARPERQGAAVLGAGRRGPEHVKAAGREHGHGLQAAHVGADGRLRPGIKIQAYYLPAQLREGPAHRPSPRTVPAIVASSLTGWKASQITAANKAQQKASSRLHRARSQSRKRSWSSSSKNRAWLRLRAVGLPHIWSDESFLEGTKKARFRPSNGAHPGQGADQLPRRQVKSNPMWRSTEPAAVMWEPWTRPETGSTSASRPQRKPLRRCGQAGASHVRQASD